MKLLNLDELSPVVRQVVIKGQTYGIREQSVQGMIDALRIAEHSASASDKGMEEMFESMVRLAMSVLDDCPEKVIRGLSVSQMRALLEFANASDEEVVEGAESPQGDPEKK